jgi:putative membrane protein
VKPLLLRWAVLAVAIGVTAQVVPGVTLRHGIGSLLLVSAVFGLVNALIGPIVRLLSLPLILVTFGLFALVINAAMLELTSELTDRLSIANFGDALLAALVMTLVSALVNAVIRRRVRS